ncbi:MAG: excinuclease ABC subunit UvrA [Spirochaetes bacterium]|nr:excinuclease ABC subunit UvrA [Spirochaetota bacterium]
MDKNHTHVIIENARVHNLKNVSLEIPRHHVVVFTGVSGSGKSSLVFDTIYTEAQRQLIETFSTFARRRLPKLSRPDVDEIRNISTAVIIDQKKIGSNIRSTVGTATEIYTHLKLLFSRIGSPEIGPSFFFGFNHPEGMCPFCRGTGKIITVDVCMLIDFEKSIRNGAVNHPDYKIAGWNWREICAMEIFDADKKLKDFSEKEINDFLYAEAIPVEKKHGAGIYSKNFTGVVRRLEKLHINKGEDQLSEARKDAYSRYFIYKNCDSCGGTRINERARNVKIENVSIADAVSMELTELDLFLESISLKIAEPIVRKMRQILKNLINIGVGYLSLGRETGSLSGGESQRIKMARQLNCDLIDMIYILDEPSVGLHPKDTASLIEMIYEIKNRGNSVFVVEHDPDVIRSAEWIVDVGPQAGINGGQIMFQGTVENLMKSESVTAQFLRNTENGITIRKKFTESYLLENANIHNLKNITVEIPKGVLTCITGVAGCGKSSLINDVFIRRQKDAIVIDQSPAGKSSRSNPATFTGMFDEIRKEFALHTESSSGLFSFNSKGACPKCSGNGYVSIEMSFLDNVTILCDECNGKKYREDVLKLHYRGKSIFDVLEMTVDSAIEFFKNEKIKIRLQALKDVGLGYLKIGQPLSSLSGGEAQRIKLASELHKKGSLYVMDEPTTGLHMADIERLSGIIRKLVENRNTVVIIEHNTDIIKQADWIIDIGPEGGNKGGEIVFEGTPEEIVNCKKSHTGNHLRKIMQLSEY